MQISTTYSRDAALDFLKGIGCLLMILAHAKVLVPQATFAIYLGGFAPVLFFSVAGITGVFQARKYAPINIFIVYSLLAFLGFAYNGLNNSRFLTDVDFDIIQIIALGTLVTYFVERYLKPGNWAYALLAALSFCIKIIFVEWLALNNYVGVSGILLPPGLFPVFPWLFLFFIGAFAYKVENRNNLLALLLSAAAYLILNYFKYPLSPQNKWNMSLGYFLLCNIMVFAVFYVIRLFSFFRSEKSKGGLLYLGKNSLLFLFIHVRLIQILINFKRTQFVRNIISHPILTWLLLLLFVAATMWLLSKTLKRAAFSRWFNSIYIWIVFVACIFLSAWLVKIDSVLLSVYLSTGILTGLYFSGFAANFKAR